MANACSKATLSSMMKVMKLLPEDNETNNDYDIFRQDYTTLEVTEENSGVNRVPTPNMANKSRHKKFLGTAALGMIITTALVTGILAYIRASKKPDTSVVINTQTLDNGALNQLSAEAGPGAKQQLTISPETLFKQNLIVQGSADIQQNLDVGGILTVRGQTILQGPVRLEQDAVLQRSLTVSGNTAIGGNLSATGSITAASLSVGSISISTVNVSSDISFGGHLVPNGATPTSRPSVAASGGNVTVTGNDTAGTIVINIGNGSAVTGEMAIVTFNKLFNSTPKVQLTPINTSASGLNYYATRSASFFTINTSTPPTNGSSYVFDYFVTQ